LVVDDHEPRQGAGVIESGVVLQRPLGAGRVRGDGGHGGVCGDVSGVGAEESGHPLRVAGDAVDAGYVSASDLFKVVPVGLKGSALGAPQVARPTTHGHQLEQGSRLEF
jgi:hypothetical protein